MFVLARGTGAAAINLYRGDAYADGRYQSGALAAGEYEFAAYAVDSSYALPNTAPDQVFEGYDLNADYSFEITPTTVPEPASWALMIVGIAFVGGFPRSTRRKVKARPLPQP